jgi:hypothetical protein
MDKVNIDEVEYIGYFKPTFNGLVNYFILESGKTLTGFYKQGHSGQIEIELPVQFNKNKKLEKSFVNSSRQVKDPNVYFLHI